MSFASMSGRVFLLRQIGQADLLHKKTFLAGPEVLESLTTWE